MGQIYEEPIAGMPADDQVVGAGEAAGRTMCFPVLTTPASDIS